MKVALINPEAPVNRFDVKGFLREPLGVLYIAPMLKRHGHEVKIFDLQMNQNLNLSKEINHYEPDIIGITSMTANFYKALKVAKLLRQNSTAFIVLGGVHATFTSNELSHHPEFDAYVVGEGEFTMLELVNTLENKCELNEVKGLVYRANGKIFYNSPRLLIYNLDAIPFPARHLIDIQAYITHEETISLITTRGCPYSCLFCSTSKLHGARYRQRSIENVMEEIKLVCERYSPPTITFNDDNFTFNKLRVKKFCQMFVDQGFDIPWGCNGHVANVDKTLLGLMRDSGCNKIFFGIESGSQQIINTLKKGFKLEQAKKALKWAKELKIGTTVSFIIGLPGENKSTIKETINFAKEIREDADYIIFSFITPFPGTSLNENLDKLGYEVIDKDFSHYTLHYPVIRPKELTITDLQSLWIEAALQLSKKVS